MFSCILPCAKDEKREQTGPDYYVNPGSFLRTNQFFSVFVMHIIHFCDTVIDRKNFFMYSYIAVFNILIFEHRIFYPNNKDKRTNQIWKGTNLWITTESSADSPAAYCSVPEKPP